MSPSNSANGPRLIRPEIAGQNWITDVEGNSLEQLLWFTGPRSRKHCMVNCSDSSSHQDFCRRLSVEPRMATCSVCDEKSSYWSFRSSLPFCFEQGSFQCIHEFLSMTIRLCSIARVLQYSLNWAEVNCVLLSDTIVSGRPCAANVLSRTLIVAEALVDDIVITSGHLECGSTKTR